MNEQILLQAKRVSKTFSNGRNTIVTDNSKISMANVQSFTSMNSGNVETTGCSKVIYVNPNYGIKNHVIHVNPKVHVKTSIHVNPKLNSESSMKMPSRINTNGSIYLNPKIVKNIDVQHLQKEESSISSCESRNLERNVQKSVYVNPKLLEKLKNTEYKENLALQRKTNTEQIHSSVRPKESDKNVVIDKLNNSNLVSISRRKIVRVKRNSKSTITSVINPFKVRHFSSAESNPSQVSENISLSPASRSNLTNNRLKFVKTRIKGSEYNSNQAVVLRGKSKCSSFVRTKVLNNSMKFVSIGGISYKSSKNRLVRRTSTSPIKRKRIISSKVQNQFFVTSNGKALRRLDTTKKYQSSPTKMKSYPNRTIIRKMSKVLLKQNSGNVKGNISNKAKQRSIQILRNKMRKNNQPCLFFQKFGYCANQNKGTCHKVHDKKQVALCRNFLQGKCLLEHCGLSHDVGPEKMPTCKYFLEGCCSRDSCPYLHVKVSENTPICRQFLQGYCEKGNQCKQRHIYACPEFEKSGSCSKGKHCPYPHKSKAPKISCNLQKGKSLTSRKPTTSKVLDFGEFASRNVESRKRYYDNSSEDLEKKREKLLKKLNIIHMVQADQSGKVIKANETIVVDKCPETEENVELKRPKRPPIGHLPSYIPIN